MNVRYMIVTVVLLLVVGLSLGIGSASSPDLKVNVKNTPGYTLPDCGGTIEVVLFDKDYNSIEQKSETYSGGESQVQLQFDDLADDKYIIEVYQIPNAGMKLSEFWGSMVVEVNVSTTVDFVRHTQWISDVKINGESPYEDDMEVNVGEKVHVDVTVQNDEHISKDVKVKLILDRDKASPYDFENAEELNIQGSEEGRFGYDFYPEEIGTYYFYIVTEGEYNNKYVVVDQHDWYKGIVVKELYNREITVHVEYPDGGTIVPDTAILYNSSWNESRRLNPSYDEFTFTDIDVGTYHVEAYKDNMWIGSAENIEVEQGEDEFVTITTLYRRSLDVTVFYEDGVTHMEGATVKVYSWDSYNQNWDYEYKGTTNSQGNVVFSSWPTSYSSEKYKLLVEHNGYSKTVDPVYVDKNNGSSYQVIMPETAYFEIELENPSYNIAFGDFIVINGTSEGFTNLSWSLLGPYDGYFRDVPVSTNGEFKITVNTTDLYLNHDATDGYYELKVEGGIHSSIVPIILRKPWTEIEVDDRTVFPNQVVTISGTTNAAPTNSQFDDATPNNITIYFTDPSDPELSDWRETKYNFTFEVNENQSFELEFKIPSEWHDNWCYAYAFAHTNKNFVDDTLTFKVGEVEMQVLNPETWVISSPGYYKLKNNVTFNGTYILIESDDVIFDGNEHIIKGHASILVYDGRLGLLRNITLKNCDIPSGYVSFRDASCGNLAFSKVKFAWLLDVQDMRISNNSFSAGHPGLESNGLTVWDASNISIINNTVQGCSGSGIELSGCENSTISNNRIVMNGKNPWWIGAGIKLKESRFNTIFNNLVIDNELYGIYIDDDSMNNTIYGNYFDNNNNSFVYHDEYSSYIPVNIWNSTREITYTYKGNTYTNYLGNYWSDYVGSDTSPEDGIGDEPYNIDGDQDDYPLMQPFENYISDSNTGNLTVNVYNVNGDPAAEVEGTTKIELIKAGETLTFEEKTIDGDSKATFTIPAGEYYFNVWHDPQIEQGRKEHWGQKKGITVAAGEITETDFYRQNPYVEKFNTKEVDVNNPTEVNVTIKVPSNFASDEVDVKASVILKNESGQIVLDEESGSETIQKGDDSTFTFNYDPPEPGVYTGLAKAYIVGGGEICTDNYGWVEFPFQMYDLCVNVTAGDPSDILSPVVLTKVELNDSDGAKVGENLTNITGYACFNNLNPGDYQLEIINGENIEERSIELDRSKTEDIILDDMDLCLVEFEVLHYPTGKLPDFSLEINNSGKIHKSNVWGLYLPCNESYKSNISSSDCLSQEFWFKTLYSEIRLIVSLIQKEDISKQALTGFNPFYDTYIFENWGAEVSERGICYGMVSTSLLYYEWKKELYSGSEGGNVAPHPLDFEDLVNYTPEHVPRCDVINQDQDYLCGYWDFKEEEVKKLEFDGAKITPLDNVMLSVFLHQVKQLPWARYSISSETALSRIEDGFPVIIVLESIYGGKHAILAFGYVKKGNDVYFKIYDPNRNSYDPLDKEVNLIMNWAKYNLSDNSFKYLNYDIDSFETTNTLTWDDFRWIRIPFGGFTEYHDIIGNYTILASSNPVGLTTTECEKGYCLGFFDSNQYKTDIDHSTGFMEYRKSHIGDTLYIGSTLYVVAYPTSTAVTVETEEIPDFTDPLVITSVNFNRSLTVVSEDKIVADVNGSSIDVSGQGEVQLQINEFKDDGRENKTISLVLTNNSTVYTDLTSNYITVDYDGDGEMDSNLSAPTADFSTSPQSPTVDDTITFNANTSFDLDGNVTTYRWTFGDSNTASGSLVEHSYSDANNYTVNLTVEDDDGLLSTTSKQISVLPAPQPTKTPTPASRGGGGGGGGGGLPLPTATPTETPKPTSTSSVSVPSIPSMPSTPEETPETPTETPTAQPTATPTKTPSSFLTSIWQQPTVTIGIVAVIVAAIVVIAYAFRRK